MKSDPRPALLRSQLIARVAAQLDGRISPQDADQAVRCLLDALTETLARGERIEIRGFGSFTCRYREPRPSRNPKTGEAIVLPGRYAVHFKPGMDLRDRLKTAASCTSPAES